MQTVPLPEQVMRAISLLEASGFEAYLVGGCVRDLWMGASPADYDLTTNAKPMELTQVFRDHRVIETGVKHGTITVLIDQLPLEITTYRKEGDYSDGRRPDAVFFCTNVYDDLARRDFTMNAMAYHPSSGLLDPYGGKHDLAIQCIRCVGIAERRFQEDALRILRAIRFASALGFSLEAETERALLREAEGLRRIAAERIRVELEKMLCGKNAPQVLLDYRAVFTIILPELLSSKDTERSWQQAVAALSHTPPEPILRWSVLLHAIGRAESQIMPWAEKIEREDCGEGRAQTIDRILKRLRFDRKGREQILRFVEAIDTVCFEGNTSLLRSLSTFGVQPFFQLLQIKRAIDLAKSARPDQILMQYDELEKRVRLLLASSPCLNRKDLAVKGEDLISLGFEGVTLGRVLNDIWDLVLFGEEKNDKESLLARVQTIKEGNNRKK